MKENSKICKGCGNTFYFCGGNKIEQAHFKMKLFCTKQCSDNYFKEKQQQSGKGSAYYKLRFEILKRDNFRCFYCGRSSIEDGVVLEIDHIIPRNGESPRWQDIKTIDELVTACRDCNTGKSNRKLELPILDRIKKEVKLRENI